MLLWDWQCPTYVAKRHKMSISTYVCNSELTFKFPIFRFDKEVTFRIFLGSLIPFISPIFLLIFFELDPRTSSPSIPGSLLELLSFSFLGLFCLPISSDFSPEFLKLSHGLRISSWDRKYHKKPYLIWAPNFGRFFLKFLKFDFKIR